MSIKIKILIPMIILTITATMTILFYNISLFSKYVDESISSVLDLALKVAENEIESYKMQSKTNSLNIAEDSVIIDAIVNNDRDMLLTRAVQIQNEAGIEFCTITDADGIVLIRTHEPENYGDSITNQANVISALSGKSITVIEQGSLVRLSVRSGSPIYDDKGNIIGVASVGNRLDTNNFVDKVKLLTGCEVTIFLGDERVSTTVVKNDGTRSVGTNAAANVSKIVLAGNKYSGQAKILERDALTRYGPIWTTDNKVIGMVFVGQFIDNKADTVNSFIRSGLFIMLLLFIISIPVILFIVNRIVIPIKNIVNAAYALACGDTEVNVQINTNDEMRELADAFNNMIENTRKQSDIITAISEGDLTVTTEACSEKDTVNNSLISMINLNNNVFSQIAVSANQVALGAHQTLDNSKVLAQGDIEQVATVEELSGIICDVDEKMKNSADVVIKAAALADTIKGRAEKGSEQMQQMVQSVIEINEANQSINKIIKVIDDIAFQTNILALNASVEAARAGSNGKGFAVVAEEVRNLAAKSAEAAKDTGSIIEASIIKAENGVNLANETAVSLNEIVSGINDNGQFLNNIADSIEQQSIAMTRINEGIKQVAQVVRQNSAISEENAAAGEELNRQSVMLQKLISRFNLKK